VVRDKDGNDLVVLKKAVLDQMDVQLRKGHLLFWYGVKKISEDEETKAIYVTNLKTLKTELVRIQNHIKQYIVSPNAKKIAFLYDSINLLLVYDLETKEAKKIEKRRLDKSKDRYIPLIPSLDAYPENCSYDLLGWSSDDRDLWFLYYSNQKSTFMRWRDGELQHFDYRDDFRKNTYGTTTYARRNGFYPDKGWVLHHVPPDGEELFVSDLVHRRTVSLGGSMVPFHSFFPIWCRKGETPIKSRHECVYIEKVTELLPPLPEVKPVDKQPEAPEERDEVKSKEREPDSAASVIIALGVACLVVLGAVFVFVFYRKRKGLIKPVR
jgi:hypothetical protein